MALTPRAVACGILLGIAVCLTNTYFGLQAGLVSPMPMQSALLGFTIFQSIRPRLARALTPMETTIIEAIAGSLGLAPFTLGLTSFIPALEFLAKPEENGPVRIGSGQLLLWATATCGLGIVAAVPFRRLLILKESLPYPSATATGALIGILFREPEIIARAKPVRERSRVSRVSGVAVLYSDRDVDARGEAEPLLAENPRSEDEDVSDQHTDWPALRLLLYTLAGSLLFSVIAYFLPILHRVPIFGLNAASQWMWAFDLSPAYVGYGIIIGPRINTYVLAGTIVGWGILSPMAKHRGWAPGPTTDFENGPRGWILCVGLGFILGDTVVAVGWICFKPFLYRAGRWVSTMVRRSRLSSIDGQRDGAETPLLGESPDIPNYTGRQTAIAQEREWPNSSLITTRLVVWTGAALLLVYLISIPTGFGHLVSAPATLLAALLIPMAGFISMRSMGETDNGASVAIGRLAQFAVARLFSYSSPRFTSANLLLGGAIESGASQAAQQMGNLKIASITHTAPRAVMFAQMIGSYAGAFAAILFYKIYSSLDKIPSEEFSIPDAHLYITTSRFIRWQGLPPGVTGFLIGSFVLGASFSVLGILSSNHRWRPLVPSGVAIAIGMYIVPAIALPRALGGLLSVIATRRYGLQNFTMICCATGLILGQGLFSPVSLLFDALHLPTLWN